MTLGVIQPGARSLSNEFVGEVSITVQAPFLNFVKKDRVKVVVRLIFN